MCEFAWDVLTFKYKSPMESNYCRPQTLSREIYAYEQSNRLETSIRRRRVPIVRSTPCRWRRNVHGEWKRSVIDELYRACQFTRGILKSTVTSRFGTLCTSFFVQKEHRSMMRLHDETTTFIIPTRLYFWPCAFAQHFGMSNPWSGFDLRIATAFRSGSNVLNNDGTPSHMWRRPLLTIWRKLTLFITLNVVPTNQPSSYFSKFVSPPKNPWFCT